MSKSKIKASSARRTAGSLKRGVMALARKLQTKQLPDGTCLVNGVHVTHGIGNQRISESKELGINEVVEFP
jgi:hypothetical protein